MKALVYTRYGSPDRLQIREVPKPVPKADEVLIKVLAASVNSWDYDLLTGEPCAYRLFTGILKPRDKILGFDVAGRVESVGKNVSLFQAGDEVFGDLSSHGKGGFAEYVCAKTSLLARKSPRLTFPQAAALPQAGVLALQGLRKLEPITDKHRILINGAGGGVGTFAVQLAKLNGAEVTAVDRTEKLEKLLQLGADRVFDFTREDFVQKGGTYDLILDVTARRSIFQYQKLLTPTGIFVMIGGSISRILQVGLLGPFFSKKSAKWLGLLLHQTSANDLGILNELFESGKVVPVIDTVYPIHQAAEAFRKLGAGLVFGKVVILLE